MNTTKRTVLTALLAVASVGAFAQSTGTQEAQTRRGPYLTNRFFDNWFLSVGAGAQVYEGDNDVHGKFGDRIAPAFDAAIGKWITPSVGIRLQYSGLQAKGWTKGPGYYSIMKEGADAYGFYKEKFNISNLHADFLWNVSNAFGGYRSDRTWEFVPYVGFGWVRSFENSKASYNDFSFNVGLLHKIRISNAVDFNIEMRQMFVNTRFNGVVGKSSFEGMTTVSLGFTYNFNRRGFSRPTVAIPADYTPYNNRIRGLEQSLADMQAQRNALAQELDAARKAPKEVVKVETKPTPVAIFFKIGKADLTPQEIMNLGYQAQAIKNSPNLKFRLIGSADSATGSKKINQTLSQKRAQAVYDTLVNTYGVNPSQLDIVAEGGIDKYQPIQLNRVVIVQE